ncbi:MAG: hypothetical protein JSS66_15865 [Armatimonadetes bacterium]|nr:hypothetical protein [Armatimonadota bacterium]
MKHLTLLALALVITGGAQAQWVATDIHPGGYTNSAASLGDGATIYGGTSSGGIGFGGYFSGGSFTSMNPGGADNCGISAVDGGHQYGTATYGSAGHAGRWTGTGASFLDWNPTGSTDSYIYTAQGGVAGGYATLGGTQRATLWNGGGKDDTTDLHKDAWLNSAVDAIDGGVQYGDAEVAPDVFHAVKWNGSAASAVDLNPGWATSSQIIGANGARQAGFTYDAGIYRAATWMGSAGSAVDINPLGYDQSIAYDLRGNWLAGTVFTNNTSHAGFWDLNSNTFVDLQQYLVGYSSSAAYGMQVTNGQIQVYGMAWDTSAEHYHAMVWSQPVPEPTTFLALAPALAWLVRRRNAN